MNISIDQFTRQLTASGLLTNEELSEFRRRLPRDDQSGDARRLALDLVRSGMLTRFQAACAYRGKARRLVFGQYVILDKLGAGGMGTVFRARDRHMQREVAIKVLLPEALKKQELVERFHREVQAAARLNHTNIVTAYDAGVYRGHHYLVMECVDGQDLASLVREKGPLPVDQAIDFAIQAARGLQHAHERGVVHRDIKPANLLLDADGTIKILDMGLARLAERRSSADGLTQAGQIMGTVDFMSPEQARDIRNADSRADIYSLGCTLYTLLTARSVYRGETMMNIMMAHCEQPVPRLREARHDVPPRLDLVIQKMLAKQRDDRQQSMDEVIADLEACRAPETSSRRRTSAVPKRRPPRNSAATLVTPQRPRRGTLTAVIQPRPAAATGSTTRTAETASLLDAAQDTTPQTPRTLAPMLTG